MPTTLPQLVDGAEKIGFATGLAIIALGYGVRARRRRLKRLEAKIDNLAELERDVAEAVAPAAAG